MIDTRVSQGTNEQLQYGLKILEEKLGCDPNVEDYEMQIGMSGDGVTARKITDAVSWTDDLTANNLRKLFTLKPTAIPELSQLAENEIVKALNIALRQRVADRMSVTMQDTAQQTGITNPQNLYDMIQQNGEDLLPSDEEIEDMARQLKGRAQDTANRFATRGAQKAALAIQDVMDETNFSDTWRQLLVDYRWAPYVCMRRVNHFVRKRQWKGNKFTIEKELQPHARRIPPQNVYWTADSTTPRDGTAFGDIFRLRKHELQEMWRMEDNPFLKSQIKDCMGKCENDETMRQWSSKAGWVTRMGSDSENDCERDQSPWLPSQAVDCFRLSALVDTCLLDKRLGLDVETENNQVEVELWLIDEYIVRFELFEACTYRRPYYFEPYQRVPGKMHGRSFPTVLRGLEHKARSTDRAIIRNLGWSSAPINLIDTDQFANPAKAPDEIWPGMNIQTQAARGASQKPVDSFMLPSNVAQYRQYRADIDEQADLRSGIPRFAMGQTANMPSALRSTSMLAATIGNATKTLKRELTDMSRGLIVPLVEDLFEHLMCTTKDDEMKVDASVYVGGVESLVQKEFATAQIRDLLQYLGPYVDSQQIPQSVTQELIFKFLSESGVTLDEQGEDVQLVNAGAEQLGAQTAGPQGIGGPAPPLPAGLVGGLPGL